jgi:hypothetical protein
MTSKDEAHLPNVKTVRDYPGHEEGRLHHGPTCPHHGVVGDGIRLEGLFPDCITEGSYGDKCWGPSEALYMKTTHVGLVLDIGEYSERDDSDFYAVVWNPEAGCAERITYASTRGWTYPNGAGIDATPEVIEAWTAWSRACQEKRRAAQELAAAKVPARGKTIRVVKGRKVPKGITGECIWYGPGKAYRYGSKPMRVGLKTQNGTVYWTDAGNVEVVLQDESVAA